MTDTSPRGRDGAREVFRMDIKVGPATRPGGDFETERAAEAEAIRLVARGAGQCVIYRVRVYGEGEAA